MTKFIEVTTALGDKRYLNVGKIQYITAGTRYNNSLTIIVSDTTYDNHFYHEVQESVEEVLARINA